MSNPWDRGWWYAEPLEWVPFDEYAEADRLWKERQENDCAD